MVNAFALQTPIDVTQTYMLKWFVKFQTILSNDDWLFTVCRFCALFLSEHLALAKLSLFFVVSRLTKLYLIARIFKTVFLINFR